MRSLAHLILVILVAITIAAQVRPPAPPPAVPSDNAVNAAVFADLDRLQSAASQTNADLGRMHMDKWKADNGTKQQSQANANSLQRNLTSALPGLISDVRSAPQDLSAGFKLYRNLNALYDVLASFTEASGAFGPKNDYDALAQQLDAIDSVRRDFGDRLEGLATQTQTEMNQLRSQLRTLQQAAAMPAAPPKKVVVDNADTGKKPVTRRSRQPTRLRSRRPARRLTHLYRQLSHSSLARAWALSHSWNLSVVSGVYFCSPPPMESGLSPGACCDAGAVSR